MRVVFFGTSSFAARILSTLLSRGISIQAIVTRPDKPKGRSGEPQPPPVKEVAPATIPVFQPIRSSTHEFREQMKVLHPDLFIVVAYGEILKADLLAIPTHGAINVHASLLPKYRGAAPIQRAIMAGESETGITIIEMSPEMDAGPILGIARIPIGPEMTFGELEPLLCQLGGKLLLQVIGEIETGKVRKLDQEVSQVTFAPKLKPEEEKIDWSLPAKTIHRLICAFSPTPGAWTEVQTPSGSKRLKILLSEPLESDDGSGWIVSCGKGFLKLLSVQLEGKKRMSADELRRGYPSISL